MIKSALDSRLGTDGDRFETALFLVPGSVYQFRFQSERQIINTRLHKLYQPASLAGRKWTEKEKMKRKGVLLKYRSFIKERKGVLLKYRCFIKFWEPPILQGRIHGAELP